MIEDFDEGADSGAFQEHLKRYEKMMSKGEDQFFDAYVFEDLLDHFMMNNQTKKAMGCVEKAVNQYPFNHTFQLRKSQLLTTAGKWTEAFKILQFLEASYPTDDEVLLTLANIYSVQRNYDKAILYYEKAIDNIEDGQVEDIVMDLALEYENADLFDKAIHILESALNKNPNNEAFIYELAYCFEITQKPMRAIEYYEKFIDANPYSFIAWYNLGNAFYKIDQLKDAVWAYDYSIIINEEFKSAYFNKANVLMAQSKYSDAIEEYRASLFEDQPDALTFSYIGECYEKLQAYDTAEHYYNKAIALSDEIAEAWFGKGIVADLKGFSLESRNFLQRAVDLDPSNVNYKVVLAESYEKAAFHESAVEVYESILQHTPNDSSAVMGWARMLEELHDIEYAVQQLETHIFKNNIEGEILMFLAMVMWKAALYTESLLLIDQELRDDFGKRKSLFLHFPEAKNIEEIQNLIEINRTE